MSEYGITEKVFGIVTDNNSTVVKESRKMKEEIGCLPIRWMGLVLQLIVKKVLNNCNYFQPSQFDEFEENDPNFNFKQLAIIMSKSRSLVTSFNHSSQLKCLLEKCQRNSENVLMLTQDVSTRWHSTYLMLNRILKLHNYIDAIFHLPI